MSRAPIALVLAALCAGCALKPPPDPADVRRDAMPNLAVPDKWTAQGAAAGVVADGLLASFHDAQLDALVREVVANNADLRVAAARVEEAAAYAKLAGATLYPQVSIMARGGGKLSGDGSGLQGGGIFLSWELDLWGRVRSGREAARFQYESTVLDAAYARQSMAALAAKGWFLATEARLQKVIAQDMVRSSERLVSLALDRQRVGRGDEYDVALARAGLQTYRDAAEQLELARQQALRSLEALAGRYPAASLEAPASLDALPGAVPAGMPSELLERRPDVVAAERRVAAAFYRVEESKAARLPRISLTASGTSISSDLFILANHANPVWGIGAMLMAPLFTGGALESQVEIRTAEQKLAVAEYGQVGQRAFGEVENALASEFTLQSRAGVLRNAVAENERALEFANVRYRVGSGDLRAVQQQQLAVYAARTALLRVQAEQLAQRVNLYLALGGGWEHAAAETAPAGAPQK
ncbi:MAG TPA: TolC family protein [Burkholderiales bacterium]|nr:TolC family protein [Burkholderiales bacterium]